MVGPSLTLPHFNFRFLFYGWKPQFSFYWFRFLLSTQQRKMENWQGKRGRRECTSSMGKNFCETKRNLQINPINAWAKMRGAPLSRLNSIFSTVFFFFWSTWFPRHFSHSHLHFPFICCAFLLPRRNGNDSSAGPSYVLAFCSSFRLLARSTQLPALGPIKMGSLSRLKCHPRGGKCHFLWKISEAARAPEAAPIATAVVARQEICKFGMCLLSGHGH